MAYPLRIQPVKLRRGGLDSVRAEVPLTEDEWRDGVDFTSQCAVSGGGWGCSGLAGPTVTDGDKTPFELDTDVERFQPTMIWATTGCTVAGTQTIIGNVIDETGIQALDRVRWDQIAGILYDGQVGRGAPNLGLKDAVVVSGQSLTDPAGITPTLQGMLEYLDTARDQQGVLHVPQQYLPYFIDERLVEWDGTNYRHGANLIVSFDAYVNAGPDASASTAELTYVGGDNELTIVATGIGIGPTVEVLMNDGETELTSSVDYTVDGPSQITITGANGYGDTILGFTTTNVDGDDVATYSGELDLDADGDATFTTGADQPADDEFWMYLTAQPLISLAGTRVQGVLTAQQNLYEVLAEQPVIALLDPCLIVAGKARVCA